MNKHDVQMLMAEVGWYAGTIDGDAGPKTWAAVTRAESLQASNYRTAPNRWSRRRRLIGAGQAALTVLGREPGVIDGYNGHNTREALIAWRSGRSGASSTVDRVPDAGARTHAAQSQFPRQRDLERFYGPAGGPQCTAGKVELPYPMVIAWNKNQRITRFSCHEKVAQPMTGIFQATLQHYGLDEIKRLQLNIFGGCYNFRKMRGGKALSTHAYGIAVDLNPEKNQLRWGADRAQFAKPEYEPFWNIVMAHGATPAGYAWGKDWMHFQFARL